MASSYSPYLKLELIGTGDQSGTWGNTTNNNLGTLLEEAIVGYASYTVPDGADTTLPITDGTSSTGRNYVINLVSSGALTAARNVLVPAIEKPYIFINSTTGGFSITVKVSGGTGVVIAPGKKAIVFANGADVIEVANAPVTELGTQTLVNKTIIGGTAVSSTLTIQSTSASGTSDAIIFNTGNAVQTLRLRTDQNIVIGTGTGSAGQSVSLNKNLTGGVNTYGFYNIGTVQSDSTSSTSYYYTSASTAASVFTITNLRHYFASQGTFGAGSTVTNQYGYFANNDLVGATSNYGFFAANSAGITAGKTSYGFYSNINTATGGGTTYAFYASGTAPSYFGGNVGIGTNAPSNELTIYNNDAGALADTLSLEMYRDSASPAASDGLSRIVFTGRNSVGTKIEYANIYVQITDAVAGRGYITLNGSTAGAGDPTYGLNVYDYGAWWTAASGGTYVGLSPKDGNTGSAGIELYSHTSGTSGPYFGFFKSRGVAAAPTATQNGDVGISIVAYVHTGSAWVNNASIISTSTEAASAAAYGSQFFFRTVLTGTTTGPSTRLLIDGSGNTLTGNNGTFGYNNSGTGGTVTQATSKSTGVTLNKVTGQITMNAAALAASTTVSFTFTNSYIAANDMLMIMHSSGGTGGAYTVNAATGAGTATVYIRNVTAGSLSEAIVLQYFLIKGSFA